MTTRSRSPHWMDGGRERLVADLAGRGQPAYRAGQLLQAYAKHPLSTEPTLTTWPQALVDGFFADHDWCWSSAAEAFADPDGTRKWVVQLNDGARMQCVMIPDGDRRTLCLSSQVGCAMGCTFCSTGDMGYGRQLGAGEIVGQYLMVDRLLRDGGEGGLTNVVFMGMGEPMHNEAEVRAAIAWLTEPDPRGLGLAAGRLTVSTVGLKGTLARLIDETRVNVAVSLHAADPAVRREIVPAERGMGAADLRRVLAERRDAFGQRKLTLEVVLIPGVNDRPADADALAAWVGDLPARVNLIPYNPYPGGRYERPSADRVLAFQERLKRAGVPAFVRRTRGERIQAACGTLNTVSDKSAPERMRA